MNLSQNNLLARSFWSSLSPQLHIENSELLIANNPFDIDANAAEKLKQQLTKEGYCRWSADLADWQLPILEMKLVIDKLVGLHLLPIFALVYDEFWVLFLRQRKVLEYFLDGNYYMIPIGFWIWHIDPAKQQKGWSPHRDRPNVMTLRDDGSPNSLTLWIPLSKATVANGCVNVLPIESDPVYGKKTSTEEKEKYFGWQINKFYPLEAFPGDILCWNHELMHGAIGDLLPTEEPRVSIATEFQRVDAPALSTILMENSYTPHFEQRLQLIAKLILYYQHKQKADDYNLACANHIFDTLGAI